MLTKEQKEKVLEAMGLESFHGVYMLYKSVWRDLKTGRLYSDYNYRRFYYEIGRVAEVKRPANEDSGQCASGIHVGTIKFARKFRKPVSYGYWPVHHVVAERVLIACQFHIDDVVWAGDTWNFINEDVTQAVRKGCLPDKIRVRRVLPIGFVQCFEPKLPLVTKYARVS